MARKWFCVSLSVIVAAALLAGCSGNSPSAGGDSAGGNPSANDDVSNQKVELFVTSYSGMTTEQFDGTYRKYLAQKFPNYTFNFMQQRGSNVRTADMVAAGTPIDILFEAQSGLIDGVMAPGLGYDISDLAKKNNVDLNRFEPTALNAMKAMTGGQLYGLPSSMQVMVTTYNKDVFDKFGAPYPKDGMTWDEALELARKVSRNVNGVQYFGLVASTGHILKLSPFSLPYVDVKSNKSTYGDEKWKIILNTVFRGEATQDGFVEWVRSHNNKVPGRDEFIKDQNIGMYVFFYETIQFPGIEQLNWDFASVPVYKELPGVGVQNYPNYVLISKTSQNKEAAMKVLAYLTSDEFQMALSRSGIVSSLSSDNIKRALGQDYPKKVNWGAVYYNKFAEQPPKGRYENIAEKQLSDLIPKFIVGDMDVNTVLRTAQDAADKAIAAEMAK
jgi:multiple sugar transport system substrate-binding protein